MIQLQEWVKKDMQTRDTNQYYLILTKPEYVLDEDLLRKVGYDNLCSRDNMFKIFEDEGDPE